MKTILSYTFFGMIGWVAVIGLSIIATYLVVFLRGLMEELYWKRTALKAGKGYLLVNESVYNELLEKVQQGQQLVISKEDQVDPETNLTQGRTRDQIASTLGVLSGNLHKVKTIA